MISNNFGRAISIFLTIIFVLGIIPSAGFAQVPPPLSGEIRGFNRAVFDSHFSRADREINPQLWLAEAKTGITQAIYAWELFAFSLYENPLLFNEAKIEIERWSNEELETRFSRWLLGRFFGDAAEKAIMEMSAALGATQRNYTWLLDDEGNIIFDDRTGDPMIIRPDDPGGESSPIQRSFLSDLINWRNDTEYLVTSKNVSFDALMTGLYTELLAYIPEEMRDTMSAVIMETGSNISTLIKSEFENIVAREERIFTSRRTRDIWSLRRKSDDEAARLFTQRLILETEETCAMGIEELKTRIEEASAGTGDLAILGEEWLRLYKEQFERGLKAWEEAEERFFIRRIEWEQESFRLFSEGEGIWLAAFNQFEEERKTWELKTKELFQSGELMFKNISEDFQRNIAEAKHEFELNMAMRIGEGTTKVKALIDMYLICSSAAISAMDNVQFWHSQYNGLKPVSPKEPDFNTWLLEELEKTNSSSLLEIKKSHDLYASYMEKAMDARDRILADYAELLGTGALKDILSPGASSEDFCLDEYQIALVRAKALVLYWERKTAIAQAVMAYANEFSAGRMTEAEGLREWENAKTAYNESLAAYERELVKLNSMGEGIREQQELLHKLTQQILQEEEKLNRLNSDYSAIVAASIVNRGNFYLQDLNLKYNFLAEEYRLFLQSGSSAVYNTILEYGNSWGIAEHRETAALLLDMLVNGYGVQLPSLSNLQKSVLEGKESETSLILRLAAIDLFADNAHSQLRSRDSDYSGAEWYAKAKCLDLTDDEKVSLYGELLSARLVADYKNSSEMLLEKRIELELSSLAFLLDEGLELDDTDYVPSELCLIDIEAAGYVYKILLDLQKRINLKEPYYTENDEGNEIINYFLSGGSFFSDSAMYLKKYIDDFNLCLGLLELYNDYAIYSSFAQMEMWQDTCNSLVTLFEGYGIELDNFLLPDVLAICESINRKPGDFIANSAMFLLEFEKCFQMNPQWLEYELNIWKDSIIEFFATYAFFIGINPESIQEALSLKQIEIETRHDNFFAHVNSRDYMDENEAERTNQIFTELIDDVYHLYYSNQIIQLLLKIYNDANTEGNEKHWRQYLTDEYITVSDSSIKTASSWKEGVFADALFGSGYYTNRINDSFKIFSQEENNSVSISASHFYDLYMSEVSRIDRRFDTLSVISREIANMGRSFEFSAMSPEELETQLGLTYNALKIQEEIFNSKRNEYFLEAEKFLYTGSLYDEQYSLLKKAHDNTDLKRFEYEKQDAIQRWAGTAYLGTDIIGLENCEAKLQKAQTVLDVLSDIYNGENRRSYNNPEYDAIYSNYEQSFKRKIKTLETVELVLSAAAQEYANNEKIFSEYQKALHQLGFVDTNYSNYLSSDSRSAWSLKDIILVNDGRLAFSKDDSMHLTGIDSRKAGDLNNFFNTSLHHDDERFEITLYEDSLRELSQRMTGYFTDVNKFKQWSLARDYLITSLIKANGDLSFLNGYHSGVGQMSSSGSMGSLWTKSGVFVKTEQLYSVIGVNSIQANSEHLYRQAWEGLSSEEKADLEYYVILTLNGGGNDYFAGFSQMFTLDVYTRGYNYVNEKYLHAKKQTDTWWKFLWSWIYITMRDVNHSALKRIEPALSETRRNVQNWTLGLQRNILSIQNYSSAYIESCRTLEIFEGKNTGDSGVAWDKIYSALLITGISEAGIDDIRIFWEEMRGESDSIYENVSDALAGLYIWTRNTENKNRAALEERWLIDAQIQRANENIFLIATEDFYSGNIDIETLKEAAEKAYGENAAAWKNHLENMHVSLLSDLSIYSSMSVDFYNEFKSIGDEITILTARTLENRYYAELAARETEWNLLFRDLSEKYNEWLVSAAMILENGRTDWNVSVQKMEDAYKQWVTNFQNEYSRVSSEWSEAYLAGLEDKERWLAQVAAAANEASAESFLLLVGTEGERLSRFMDTREPLAIRNAVPDTETLITSLLQSSGIANMYNAFGFLNNITGAASPLVRRGLGSVSNWDAALAKTAASDLARKTNAEIADRESRKLAYGARMAADEAINHLAANIDSANQSFRTNMDNIFIFSGLWRRSGSSYVKDIVRGSTLFTPVVSNRITITGYINYAMEPVALNTNLDENYLASLDSIAVMGLVENVFLEVEAIAAEIFGIGAASVKIFRTGNIREDRELSPGKFGAHIGYNPAVKPENQFGKTRNSIFYDEGAGEIGRLLTEFIYWNVIDTRGSAELALPFWDKRIWNDEGSFFKAPSLRSVGQIAGSIAAAAFTGGTSIFGTVGTMVLFNSASDILFGTLDLAFGYKTADEVGFNIGKSLLMNTAGSITSGIFSGFGGIDSVLGNGLTKTATSTANSAAGKVITQTLMTGAQTFTTGFVTSAIGGITYSREGGLGYSSEAFTAGMNSAFVNSMSSMTSTFTSGTLQAVNSGLSMEKLAGFNSGNMNDILKLNNLIGSLAGQGVNYAMGSGFTLNLLNTSLFSGGRVNHGLLELRLDGSGAAMNIGAGGANVSFDNLAAAFRGAQVWNVNSEIYNYIRNENIFDSSIALRAQYGFGDYTQKNLLREILKGTTELWADTNGDFSAETIFSGGTRVINLLGYKQGMSMEEQMRLAVILGHEAYRDGIVSGDNHLETRTAVSAGVEMAKRMLKNGQQLAFDNDLIRDIVAYSLGEDFFNTYVDTYYDSSADYWKLMRDGTLVNDNSGWLKDENGKYFSNADGKRIGAEEIETGLLNILFGGTHNVGYNEFTDVQVFLAQSWMISAGMKYTDREYGDIRSRSWTGNSVEQSLNMQRIMRVAGSTVAAPVFARYYENNAISFASWVLGRSTDYVHDNIVTRDAFSRYTSELVPAVFDYFNSMRHFFDNPGEFRVTAEHGRVDSRFIYENYFNNAHFGTDFSNGESGAPIYIGIPGIVMYTAPEEESGKGNGNWLVAEYGYMFGGSFIGSGIFGEYMHMEKLPAFRNNTYLNSNQIIGSVGSTGNSTGAHLHYSIYTLEGYSYSQRTLQMILNNNIGNTVMSTNPRSFIGTYNNRTSRKVTYNIENFLRGL